MTTMIAALYDALKDAGASDEKARKAAESVAAFESRSAKLEADNALLKWMVGFNIALTLLVLGKLFLH